VAPVIYLDTHVVAWLFAGRLELFPSAVRKLLETQELTISPVVELELQYLFELEHTSEPGRVVVDALEREIGLSRCDLPFHQVIATALHNDWTRDPFDPIIVAQAEVRRTPLLTKDASIRDHYPEAVWLG